jgi:hypothetical protein
MVIMSIQNIYTIHHRFSWGPLPPNEFRRITQHVREEKGGKRKGRGLPTMVIMSIQNIHAIHNRLKWGSLPPNEFGRFTQLVREEKE